ncbi:SRPBCC family protein [Ilumatobacter sp.]|uniref:SRPBCC family protein n=1 Tax=Ilumatobacter sp. TaxID=1967498 RepID=UPI003C5EF4FF
MSTRSVTHDTFTIERFYSAAPHRVFAAWSDPQAKARWFSPDADEQVLDFRVGGHERNRGGGPADGPTLAFESIYHDIVDDERIVFSSNLLADDQIVTVSLTTVEMSSVDGGTRMVLTQQNAFLDGHEQPDWRRAGTTAQLDALGTEFDI